MDTRLYINGLRHMQSVSLRWSTWLKRVGLAGLLSISVPTLGQECSAVFPMGMQSHSSGNIHFGWNAQLVSNSSEQLPAAAVNINSGSSLLSCEQADCSASGQPSSALSVTHQFQVGGTDVHIPYEQTMTLGLGQVSDFAQINVGSQSTLRFASKEGGYRIATLNMQHGSKLLLAPGDYWIETLNLPSSGIMQVTGYGSARLFVKGNVQFPSQARVNILDSGDAGQANKLLVYSAGSVQFAYGAKVSAVIYAGLNLQMEQAELYGSVAFADANLNASAKVIYQSQAASSANMTMLCQGSVLPDPEEPEDIPTDTQEPEPGSCQASWPNGLQTHTENGSINFQYGAQLQGGSGNQLHTNAVSINGDPNLSSCENDVCSATGAPVSSFELDDFVFTESTIIHRSPWMSIETVGESTREFKRIELQSLADVTLQASDEPYLIKELHLGYNSRLSLPAGDYWVENLRLESEAKIQVIGEGTVRLHVHNPLLYVPWRASLNANTQNPQQMVLITYGDVDFNTESNTFALVYAAGKVALNYKAAITGGITAAQIDLGVETRVIFDSSAVDHADFGEACKDSGDNTDTLDTTAPTLHVNNPSGQIVYNAVIVISGTAADPVEEGSGIDSLVVRSDQYPDLTFTVSTDNTQFQSEVPLALGLNTITVMATDLSGNSSQVSRQLTRDRQLKITSVSPQSGASVREDTVTISGLIQAPQSAQDLRFSINEWQLIPSVTDTPGMRSFNMPDVPLHAGENTFVLQANTRDQVASYTLTVFYDTHGEGPLPPELVLLSPLNGSLLSENTFTVRGQVKSDAHWVQVNVNGQEAHPPVAGVGNFYFNSVVNFAPGASEVTVIIEAIDNLGQVATLSPTFRLDGQSPQITVNDLTPVPDINDVAVSPYQLSGTIIDDNMASFTINGQPVTLRPGAQSQHYHFSVNIPLDPKQELDLLLQARDVSGNLTSANYTLNSIATASIKPLLPGKGTELTANGKPISLQVAARVSGTGIAGVRVQANSLETELTLNGTLASGELLLPAEGGEYTLYYRAFDDQGQQIAAASRTISVVDHQATPLKLLRHEPLNNENFVETNQAIELYFNKAIDPTLLSVVVRETLHGSTYIDMDPPGKDFIDARGYELQPVNRSQEPVPGTLELLPGDNSAAFYPARHYGFSGTLLVDVLYNNEEVGRFTFTARPLPTFVIGGISDQFGQPLAGITVSLPDLGRESTTNADGSFSFGFQDSPGTTLPGGRHKLVVNSGFAVPGYGTLTTTINLQEGRRNDLGLLRVQEMHPNVSFSLISSGQEDVSLAGHNLQLDLSDARLLFDNRRDSGSAHVQFLSVEQITAKIAPNAWPHWVFATQPRGIGVEGEVGVTLQVPPLYGSYDYLLLDKQYVVMVGYDAKLESIQIVGLGLLENRRVTSIGKLALTSLDFIGYALVSPALQPTLEEWASTGSMGALELRRLLQPD